MSLSLHTIKSNKGARKASYAIGRGLSGRGTYSGRGAKGQRSRSGGRAGLQQKGIRKLMLSMPKARGFTSTYAKMAVVNVDDISKAFASGATVTPKALLEKGLITDISNKVKVLGDGAIAIKITVEGCRISAAAKTKIEAAGGTVKK